MKPLIFLLTILSLNAKAQTIEHGTCETILTIGSDCRYATLSDTYKLDREVVLKSAKEELEKKGYQVVLTQNFGDNCYSHEAQKAEKSGALSYEMRIVAPSSTWKGNETHFFAGSAQLIDPTNRTRTDLLRIDGTTRSFSYSYPGSFSAEFRTESSSWYPVSWQYRNVFNRLMSATPSCLIKSP